MIKPIVPWLFISLLFYSASGFSQTIPLVGMEVPQYYGAPGLPAQDPNLQGDMEGEQDVEIEEEVLPFGSQLFNGNFLKTRGDGINPDYLIAPGDRISVSIWGALTLNELYTVDAQGNVFLPDIGPVRLQDVPNSKLTDVVKSAVKKVYIDNVEVYTNLFTSQPVAVYVTGLVNNPGRYTGISSDSILYYIDLAGGIDSQLGSYRDIELLRDGKVIYTIDLYEFLLNGKLIFQQLKENDTILIKHRGPVIKLEGDVAKSAYVELKDLKSSGTSVLNIVPKAARATGVTIEGIRDETPIKKTMSVLEFMNYTIHDGDVVTLRDDGRADSILISVIGDFDGPTTLSVKNGSRLVDVLNHIPIDPNLADTKSVHLRRLTVAEAQKKAIQESVRRLERNSMLALSGSSGEVGIRVQEANLVTQYAERVRTIEPLGTVVTSQNGIQQNILLEEGDTIVIPTQSQIVKTTGEVLMMSAVTHHEGWTVTDYINQSGGFSVRADQEKIIIYRPNAEVKIVDPDAIVMPGDEIMVMPIVDSKTQQFATDMIDLVYKIAVSSRILFNL